MNLLSAESTDTFFYFNHDNKGILSKVTYNIIFTRSLYRVFLFENNNDAIFIIGIYSKVYSVLPLYKEDHIIYITSATEVSVNKLIVNLTSADRNKYWSEGAESDKNDDI